MSIQTRSGKDHELQRVGRVGQSGGSTAIRASNRTLASTKPKRRTELGELWRELFSERHVALLSLALGCLDSFYGAYFAGLNRLAQQAEDIGLHPKCP